MNHFFHESALKKVLSYKRKYPEQQIKSALKVSGYCLGWIVKSLFSKKNVNKAGSSSEPYKVAFRLTNMIGDVLINLRYVKGFNLNFAEGVDIEANKMALS